MDAATVSYSLMMFATTSLVAISAFWVMFSLYEIWRRLSVRVGYQSGHHPEHGHIRMLGIAMIQRYVHGVSMTMIVLGLISSLTLIMFMAPAVNNMRKMTAHEFFVDFQKFQQERK